MQERPFCQRHTDQIHDEYKRENDGIGKAELFMLQVHKIGYDEVRFNNRQHNESHYKDAVGNWREGNSNFKNGYRQQDPECFPDY